MAGRRIWMTETPEKSSSSEDKREKEIDVTKVLVSEMKAIKKTLGKSCNGEDMIIYLFSR